MKFTAKEKKLKARLIKELQALKDKRGFLMAGLPKYNRLFGRDALISAWELLDYDPKIARDTLEILIKYQGKVIRKENEEEPGKILHEAEGYFPWNYYGSVDSTPLFLILFYYYFKKSNDLKFLKKYWLNILSAVNWLLEYGDKDNDLFLEYQQKTKKGLFHQGWKDSFRNTLKITPPVAIVEAQGYQYLAFKSIGELAKINFRNKELGDTLLSRARQLKKEFNKKFWVPQRHYFALALNGEKQQRKAITSNPGHLLFTGIVNKKKVSAVVARLFKKDMFTPFGIRTLSSRDPDFNPKTYHLGSIWPHDNWIIAQGLKNLGYKKEFQEIKKALFRAVEEFGFTPELYVVSQGKITQYSGACHPQAWSSGALLNLLLAS